MSGVQRVPWDVIPSIRLQLFMKGRLDDISSLKVLNGRPFEHLTQFLSVNPRAKRASQIGEQKMADDYSSACCTTPAAVVGEYALKGSWTEINGIKTC